MEKLSSIYETDEYGRPKMSVEQQYSTLVGYGFGAYMKYDSSGNEIDTSEDGWQATAVQALFDRMDAEKEEMQSLYDGVEEARKATVEAINNGNEIL